MNIENSPGDDAPAPSVAVLTINLNMADGLSKTIDSVRSQTFRDLEFGIVDGASLDGSQRVIAQNLDIIDWHVSEKDRGIYDGMNKAVALSHAEWILFLNSGDAFAAPDVLERVFSSGLPSSAELVYGDTLVVFADDQKKLRRSGTPERLPCGMICSHQSIFVRRSLLLEAPFTLGKSASDYEFILFAWLRGRRFHRVPIVISECAAGGVSDHRRLRSLRESWDIIRRAGLATPALRIRHSARVLRAISAQLAKAALPSVAVRWVRSKIGR